MAEFKRIRGRTGCLYLRGNCLPVYELEKREWILMDTGSRFDRGELLDFLEERKVAIRAVLVSHAHSDHVGNLQVLKERFGCETIASAFDAGAMESALSLKSCFYSSTEGEIEREVGEMVCKVGRILRPGRRSVTLHGARFAIHPLPGHSASHLGFETPDHVIYLGDCMMSPEMLAHEKLLYMLSWPRALETLEKVQQLDGSPCILAHRGVCSQIAAVARKNRETLMRTADLMEPLADGGASLEQVIRRAEAVFSISSRSAAKARLIERVVRSGAEYLTETGRWHQEAEDGLIIYRKS